MLIFRPKGGLNVDFETLGCCGLFCESCDIYQSVQKGTLKKLAAKWDMTPEDLTCGEVFSWYQSRCSRCNEELENFLDD